MTRKTFLFGAWGAVLLLAVVIGIRFQTDRSDPAESAAPTREASSKLPRGPERETAARTHPVARTPVADLPEPQLSPHAWDSPEHGEWVEARSKALLDLMWNEDRASMLTILAELRNPDPEIRLAAADATREFGSRDAIPVLEKMAAVASSIDEKKACLDLVEWLKLPSLTEHLAAERARQAAASKPAK